jgi:3-phenylpropionate/trans-cinnamate dioxygenase ferredoxin reductase component
MTIRSIVVVGASLAGAKAAEGARAAGFDGRITLVGEEPVAPYERPPLSKEILRGEKSPDSARVHPQGFYDEQRIDLVTDRAVALDLTARAVELARGGAFPFDALVLATGASPRRLPVPGANLDGVFSLRTVDDSTRLRDAIRAGGRVAVIGAGWIGSEVAASARTMGAEVMLVDPAATPLQRVLGDEVGNMFAELHADHGVDLRLGTGVAELRGASRVEEVVLADGRVEPADVVVVGVGVTPRTELAESAVALRVENGVLVDEYLQSNVEGVFAAGDVANAWHPHYQRSLRVEHWANALNQGVAAGQNAAGQRTAYTRLPYFFSDQYDLGMEYVGHAAAGDALAIRGDLAAREFVAFWHRDGVVTAAMHANLWDVTEELKAIVASRRPVDLARLTNPAVPLESVSAVGAA